MTVKPPQFSPVQSPVNTQKGPPGNAPVETCTFTPAESLANTTMTLPENAPPVFQRIGVKHFTQSRKKQVPDDFRSMLLNTAQINSLIESNIVAKHDTV